MGKDSFNFRLPVLMKNRHTLNSLVTTLCNFEIDNEAKHKDCDTDTTAEYLSLATRAFLSFSKRKHTILTCYSKTHASNNNEDI
eukprot:scaffold9478_cov138-Skeletonema_menzelii.AAC.8